MLNNERRDRGSGFRMKTLTVVITATMLVAGGAVEAESDSLSMLQKRINKTENTIEKLREELQEKQDELEEQVREVAKAEEGQRETAREQLERATMERDATQGNLSVAEQTLENDKNERDFRDLSFNTGVAVLRESGPDGGNETETMISMHQLLRTWNDESVGLGPFIAINAEGDVAELIGVGAVFSFRRENGANPLSVGAGYIIDRFGFEAEDGTRLGDRSGLFFVVSFNPAMSGVNIFENLFKLPD